ncbi:MAG: hypothetical protein SNJ33_02740 [Rikenellaceae bacterium]
MTTIFKRALLLLCTSIFTLSTPLTAAEAEIDFARKSPAEFEQLKGKKILFIERIQYLRDHHNTATMFQCGEINEKSFTPGSAMKVYDVDSGTTTTLVDCPNGVVRDPELSYDAKKIIFSMRETPEGSYNIYEMNIDGSDMRQLTSSRNSDIDPVYLPSGEIIFSSTRQPKFCMCNRHIMANLFRMEADGANIEQIGVSTLFEGHATVLDDGRVMYDRWEYVDRNFGDAQGLWVVNPDGTKHSIYYGNNTKSPGGVIDARQIPGTDLVVSIFSSCHDRPWGALAIIDRKLGVDGEPAVLEIVPTESRSRIDNGNWDAFRGLAVKYEDPWPLNRYEFLVSGNSKPFTGITDNATRSGLYFINSQQGTHNLILESENSELSLFDPMIIEPRAVPQSIPTMRNQSDSEGTFYVQNVYEGTHMEGVEKGSVKYLRIVESPEKRTWTSTGKWRGQGSHFPAVNWHSFEVKKILGEVEVEADGSAHFTAPAGKHLFFQLLDKDRKMIQSMRSGVSLMPGEVNGCIGCHEDRLNAPIPSGSRAQALRRPAEKYKKWGVKEPKNFSFMESVQPILDRHCLSCHDFDVEKPEKLVLAADRNLFFNAAYINLYLSKSLTLVGGGPANIQAAYSWGSHASTLTKMIDNGHKKVSLTKEEREMIYAWLDMNGVYYPTYETAFDDTLGGRSPITNDEAKELSQLTGVDFTKLENYQRKLLAQVSFERPELSPCLSSIRDDKAKFDRAIEIIEIGAKRLEETPRGDIESELSIHPRLQDQLDRYYQWLKIDTDTKKKRAKGEKYYD